MPKFILVRHGSNSENQPRCLRAIIGVVKGTENQAEEYARSAFTFWNNQSLEVIDAREASLSDKREAREMDLVDLAEDAEELDKWAAS